jgi:UDP-N-acetylglucosamine 2-epimerase
MKIAPLSHALKVREWCRPQAVHTGQHCDANTSDSFFRDLRLPTPAHHLETVGGTHPRQTRRTVIACEAVCQGSPPGGIVVAGDVAGKWPRRRKSELWNGHAARRAPESLRTRL